jgi:hypothetical protein
MSQHPVNLLSAVNARRAQLVQSVEETDDAFDKGALDCIENKPFDPPGYEAGLPYSEQPDSVDEYRRGYEAEARRSA